MQHCHLSLAGAALAVATALAGATARAQPIPDPARAPAVLDPTGTDDGLLRGTVAGPGVADEELDTAGTEAGNPGLLLDADGFPIDPLEAGRVTVIETGQGARPGVAQQPRIGPPGDLLLETNFVTERQRPELEALGLRAGSFIIYSEVETRVETTDNVFAVSTVRESDVLFAARPRLMIQSDWGQHELVVAYEGEYGIYERFTSENPKDYAVNAASRLDLSERTVVSTAVNFMQDQEGRGNVDVPDTATAPTMRTSYGVSGDASHRVSRLTASLRGGLEVEDFEDGREVGGAVIDNSDRDQRETEIAGHLAYEVSAATTVFGGGEYLWRKYDQALDDNGFARDARRTTLMAGVELQPRAPLRASIEIGFVHEEYDDPRLATLEEFTANAALAWAVTPITTVNAGFETNFDSTTLAGASGSVVRTASIGVNHELARNLVVSSSLSHEWNDYPGTMLAEETTSVSLDGEYWLNRHAAVVGGYEFEHQTTNGGTGTVDENVVSLGLKVRN